MTESQIERRVEHETDRLDYQFLHGLMSQEDYDKAIRALDKWAQQQFDRAR